MKEKNTAHTPQSGPRSQPTPSASFGSPSPIHAPFENSHSKKSGNAAAGPARRRSAVPKPAGTGNMNWYTSVSPANEYTHSSGMMVCLMSYTAITMRSASNGSAPMRGSRPIGAAPISAKRQAVPSSTSGYCIEMRLPQERHRPRRASHEKTGTMSYHGSCTPHDMQALLPPRLFAPRRTMTTLRKLPTMRPKRPNARASIRKVSHAPLENTPV